MFKGISWCWVWPGSFQGGHESAGSGSPEKEEFATAPQVKACESPAPAGGILQECSPGSAESLVLPKLHTL